MAGSSCQVRFLHITEPRLLLKTARAVIRTGLSPRKVARIDIILWMMSDDGRARRGLRRREAFILSTIEASKAADGSAAIDRTSNLIDTTSRDAGCIWKKRTPVISFILWSIRLFYHEQRHAG